MKWWKILVLTRPGGLVRSGVAVLTALAMLAVAAAAEATGPRLATVEMIQTKGSLRSENEGPPLMAVATVDPATGGERRFQRAPLGVGKRVVPFPFYAPTWSPDGALIAFNGHAGRSDKGRIYVVAPDGTGLRAFPGTVNGTQPVFSPDGRTLAFARTRSWFHLDPGFFKEPTKGGIRSYASTTTWIVDLAGGKPRRLTRWRDGLSHVPTSFSPHGTTLLVTKEDRNLDGPRVMQTSLADGVTRELILEAKEAVYSPDGSRIAFTGFLDPDLVEAEEDGDYLAEELYVTNADGTGTKRLSRTEGVLESAPSWDPSGQRLAYVQFRADTSFVSALALLFPTGNALMQVNADGSCRKKIVTRPKVAYYGVAWQPGPGREAGPLSC